MYESIMGQVAEFVGTLGYTPGNFDDDTVFAATIRDGIGKATVFHPTIDNFLKDGRNLEGAIAEGIETTAFEFASGMLGIAAERGYMEENPSDVRLLEIWDEANKQYFNLLEQPAVAMKTSVEHDSNMDSIRNSADYAGKVADLE